MRVPRNISGVELANLLRRHYGYVIVRQSGSHLRLVSHYMGYAGYVSVPRHSYVKIGTLIDILNEVSAYLEISRDELAERLFG